METNIITSAITLLAFGIIASFFGYKTVNFIVAAFGFTFGFLIGITVMGVNPFTVNSAENFFAVLVSLLFPIGLGAICMLIALFFTRVGVAFAGAMLVFAIVSSIGVALGYAPQSMNLIAAILGIFVFVGTFILDFYRYIVIFVTSFNGSTLMSTAIVLLVTRNNAILSAFLDGNYLDYWKDVDNINKVLLYILWLLLGVIGMVFQLKTTRD